MLMPQSQKHAHMPFLFRRDGHLQGVYCHSLPQFRRSRRKLIPARPSAWKLQWVIPFLPAMGAVDTGLNEYEDECSPTVSVLPGEIQLSFIGTIASQKPQMKTLGGGSHRLFVMKGPEINQLGPAVPYSDEECYCGFARPDLAILGTGVDGTARIEGHRHRQLRTPFKNLVRISFCFDRPSWILITGIREGVRGAQTIVVDIDTGRMLGEVKLNGQACYKPSLLADALVAPIPPSCSRGWRLHFSRRQALHPTSLEAKVS